MEAHLSASSQPFSRRRASICSRAPMGVTPYTLVITVCLTSLRSTCARRWGGWVVGQQGTGGGGAAPRRRVRARGRADTWAYAARAPPPKRARCSMKERQLISATHQALHTDGVRPRLQHPAGGVLARARLLLHTGIHDLGHTLQHRRQGRQAGRVLPTPVLVGRAHSNHTSSGNGHQPPPPQTHKHTRALLRLAGLPPHLVDVLGRV